MRHTSAALLTVAALAPIGAQAPAPLPDQPVFRTSSTLSTIDVVVVDGQGRHVTDLTKDDFEVVVGSKRQPLQHAVYVRAGSPPVSVSRAQEDAVADGRVAAANPSSLLKRAGIRPDQITRTLAFIVDDLNLSFESTYYVRKALTRYVETQMGPGDLVAIVRTASGSGALQQFTTDKRLLRLAVDRILWDFRSARGVSSFEATVDDVELTTPQGDRRRLSRDHPEEELRQTMTGIGSFSAVQYVAKGIERLPGRKSVILVSEGFPGLFHDRYGGGRLWASLTRMLDTLNRCGIVVYTMDPRGLITGGATAEDVSDPNALEDAETRRGLVRTSQESLRFIAEQTGGLAISDTNDLGRGIERILDDQQGYYLLGYAPTGKPPAGWDHDGVHVTVHRPHVRVRARQGVFGPASPNDARPAATGSLLAAALSPFASGDVSARLTSMFWYDGKAASMIRSLLFIDANDLQFTKDANGRETATLELAVLASDDAGIVGRLKRSVSVALDDRQYQDACARGLMYPVNLAAVRPGAYQIRAAVRDTATNRVGSSSQFLEVPAVGRGKLAVSGVLLQGFDPEPSEDASAAGMAINSVSADALRQATVRILPPGSKAVYAYEIYDGLRAGSDLETSTTLIRNGAPIYSSQPTPVQHADAGKGIRIVKVGGSLDLGTDAPDGTYSLRVDVARTRNGKRERRASQWVDFEVATAGKP